MHICRSTIQGPTVLSPISKSIPSLFELVGFGFELCFLCEPPCKAFNLLAGFIEPPSAYGSVNGIKLGRGIFDVTSGDLKNSMNQIIYL